MEDNASEIGKPTVLPPVIALSLAFFGWALIEACLASLHAGLALHGLVSIPGLLLIALSLRHSRKCRPWSFHAAFDASQFRRFNVGDAGTTLLLCGTGGLLGVLVLIGWGVPLVVVAMAIHFVPWWRLRLCREHFFGASTLLWLTGCLVVATGYRGVDVMTLPIAGWALWTGACFSLLQSLSRIWHAERTALSITA